MMKRWKLILILLAVAILAIAVHLRMVSTWPYPVRTFEFSSEGWYAPAVALRENEKGEMLECWTDGFYYYCSNTVTGVLTKERLRK